MDIKVESYHNPRKPVSVEGIKQLRITTEGGDYILYDSDGSLEVRSSRALDALVVIPASIGALYIELRKIT